eukprot:6013961-Prymnesium_polylepis.1
MTSLRRRCARAWHARRCSRALAGIKFTSGKDATDVCIPQYKEGFLKLIGAANELSYGGLGWGDEKVDVLTKPLVYAHGKGAMAKLDLVANR